MTHLVGHDDAGVVRSIESINPEDGTAEEWGDRDKTQGHGHQLGPFLPGHGYHLGSFFTGS